MKIKDSKVLKLLEEAKCLELEENIESISTKEINGMTDKEVLRDEVDYLIDLYKENNTLHNDNLKQAKKIMKETNCGITMPLDVITLKPKYTTQELIISKNIINEYERLKKLKKKLK